MCKEVNAQPELASVYYNIGLVYKKLGSRNRAREFFRYAQEIYRVIDTPAYERIRQEFVALNQ